MPTFCDESGDFGSGPKSSDHFHFAAVWFETIEEAQACRVVIDEVRRAENVRAGFVFHFAEISPEMRKAFLRGVSGQNFKFAVCTAEKRRAEAKGENLSRELIVNSVVGGVTASLVEYYHIAEGSKGSPLKERVTVHYHNNGDYIELIRRGFTAYASVRNPKARLVKKVSTERAESDNLVQLADMVCGAAKQNYEGERDLYRLIESKRLDGCKTWP
ncbi:Putative uncharacterized protein OS=Leptospirillum sp. Group II '5-way CG' GN=CGL2_11386017 PE=4 SV=1: DUF3800 [Gemmata massiliana]|uniref:DUF3800 domain-containing protein n=1 Tax=Gemmata massiliana TaxID=1210884 RepID=A0A6P2DKR3_9BACT|nr:Putative uncharacterized protein OS=Leptospirillum sp. Group II '5-way CG' GN=CGL2_11386017 PE=4 SV=1: DUF3800 [Gemmata massiliana]